MKICSRCSLPMLVALALLTTTACSPGETPTAPGANGPQAACLARATFGAAVESPYVLPYPVGAAFVVAQSYCNPNGGHRDTFAYDWPMPMGAAITAARGGTVIVANDQFADDDNVNGNENNVFVQHADGTVVRYTHLQQGSVVATVGDIVVAGQLLGLNGATGNTGGVPHLHLEVFRSRNFAKSNSLPINFSNAQGALDDRGGLATGTRYTALPF